MHAETYIPRRLDDQWKVGFWVTVSQLPRSHPFTVRRLERLYRLGLFHGRLREAETETPV